ncbi:AraC family transcriptional regulator [Antribacter sp. KLBMP9083]|uniref:AraC family transcriptional regulator n=1 Tax=Antribacter soli TaxID=2910976 RepID=A0AA41QCQ1_9MICO|nr:AraC family transcriptional regulator [Antribacter soli]MCF4120727.1 AraC family transcriptional regulator [Antribacter soli]
MPTGSSAQAGDVATPADEVRAWRPAVPGVAEVLHARWHEHSYPLHTHDTWTVLVLDEGMVGYALDRHEHAALTSGVTVLPPHVAHDGRSVTHGGFRKRVVYLEAGVLGEWLVGRAVDGPLLRDPGLRSGVQRLDRALVAGEQLAAESGLALVAERIAWHLTGRPEMDDGGRGPTVARRARDLLDADPTAEVRLADVAGVLGVTTAHLVRAFTREFGLPPHRYLVGRRLDLARRRLLAGEPAGQVAAATGFHDQSHLTRHFRRLLRTTPGRYQGAAGRRNPS